MKTSVSCFPFVNFRTTLHVPVARSSSQDEHLSKEETMETPAVASARPAYKDIAYGSVSLRHLLFPRWRYRRSEKLIDMTESGCRHGFKVV